MKRKFKNVFAMVVLAGFLLGIHDAHVALWADEDPHPLQVYDIRADTLPPADQVLLRRGIRANSREELWMVLENYLD